MHCSAAGLASAVTKTKHRKHKRGGTTGVGGQYAIQHNTELSDCMLLLKLLLFLTKTLFSPSDPRWRWAKAWKCLRAASSDQRSCSTWSARWEWGLQYWWFWSDCLLQHCWSTSPASWSKSNLTLHSDAFQLRRLLSHLPSLPGHQVTKLLWNR